MAMHEAPFVPVRFYKEGGHSSVLEVDSIFWDVNVAADVLRASLHIFQI